MKDYKKLRCRNDSTSSPLSRPWILVHLPHPDSHLSLHPSYPLTQPATRSSTLTSSSTSSCTKTVCSTSSSRVLRNATSSRRPRDSPSASRSWKRHWKAHHRLLLRRLGGMGRDVLMRGATQRWRTEDEAGAGVGAEVRAGVKAGDMCRGARVGVVAGAGVGVWLVGRVGRGVSVRIGWRGCWLMPLENGGGWPRRRGESGR